MSCVKNEPSLPKLQRGDGPWSWWRLWIWWSGSVGKAPWVSSQQITNGEYRSGDWSDYALRPWETPTQLPTSTCHLFPKIVLVLRETRWRESQRERLHLVVETRVSIYDVFMTRVHDQQVLAHEIETLFFETHPEKCENKLGSGLARQIRTWWWRLMCSPWLPTRDGRVKKPSRLHVQLWGKW